MMSKLMLLFSQGPGGEGQGTTSLDTEECLRVRFLVVDPGVMEGRKLAFTGYFIHTLVRARVVLTVIRRGAVARH